MLSVTRNQEVVDKYLEKEVGLGRVIGPLNIKEVPGVCVSRFGVIEKPHQPRGNATKRECILCGQAREDFPVTHDSTVSSSQTAPSHAPAKWRLPI